MKRSPKLFLSSGNSVSAILTASLSLSHRFPPGNYTLVRFLAFHNNGIDNCDFDKGKMGTIKTPSGFPKDT